MNGGRPDRAEGSAAAGDSQWMLPRNPPGLPGAWRGDAPGQGCSDTRGKTLRSGAQAVGGVPGRQAPGEGFRETAAQRRRRPVPSPPCPAPRSPSPPPARVTVTVWPRRCPRGASLGPTRFSRTPSPPLRTPARRSRFRCGLLLAPSAGTAGAGQRVAEGEWWRPAASAPGAPRMDLGVSAQRGGASLRRWRWCARPAAFG